MIVTTYIKIWGMPFWCSVVIIDGKEYGGVSETTEGATIRMFEMIKVSNKVRVNE